MAEQLYITEGGKMITRRNWQLARRLLFWVGLQVVWGVVCVCFNLRFHPRPVWKLLLVQYPVIFILWYWQLHAARLRGMDIVFREQAFDKWDLIKAAGSDILFLLYKKTLVGDGNIVYRGFPLYASRTRWRTKMKLRWIRMLIGLKLIQ